ncbi:MAG: hypothetical protein ACETWQ_12825 [Phycisphaerae bacterium]
MIKSGKHQLVIAMILAFCSVPASGVEPNLPKTKPRFEINSEEQQWQVEGGEIGKGPITPTHVAELFLPYSDEYISKSNPQRIMRMLKTAPGRSMSAEQRGFLSTAQAQDAVSIIDRYDTVRRHYKIHLYAMSEKDARKMAEAFIEALADKSEKIRSYKDRIRSLQGEIFQTKERILEKEAETEVALANLRENIKNVHYLSTDEAKQAISELNTMLNNLDIELAGMKAKLRAIQEHQERQKAIKDKKLEEGINREGILLKLEDMLIDLLIELKVAEARKETATGLRMRAEDFCKQMDAKKAEFQKDVNEYKMRVTMFEREIHQFKEKLADPYMETLPPRVFQNKVTIYPVRVEED